MGTSDPGVRYEVRAGVAHLTLDSPRNRNALSSALVAGLLDALEFAGADPGVRAVVLGHAGGTFCAGADLSEAGAASGTPQEQAAVRARVFLDLVRAILTLPKPVLAVVDGHVRAGGMGLVAACDLAIAGPSSSFALTEARLGLAAAMISLPLAARCEPRALGRYLLTGERFDAAEAARIGLLTEAVEAVDEATTRYLGHLRLGSPQGLAENKALVSAPLLAEIDARGEELAGVTARLFGTPETLEGLTAFLEKRQPAWVVRDL